MTVKQLKQILSRCPDDFDVRPIQRVRKGCVLHYIESVEIDKDWKIVRLIQGK